MKISWSDVLPDNMRLFIEELIADQPRCQQNLQAKFTLIEIANADGCCPHWRTIMIIVTDKIEMLSQMKRIDGGACEALFQKCMIAMLTDAWLTAMHGKLAEKTQRQAIDDPKKFFVGSLVNYIKKAIDASMKNQSTGNDDIRKWYKTASDPFNEQQRRDPRDPYDQIQAEHRYDAELVQAVLREVERLPPYLRRHIFDIMDGLTLEESAAKYEITLSTVETQRSRAKGLVRKALLGKNAKTSRKKPRKSGSLKIQLTSLAPEIPLDNTHNTDNTDQSMRDQPLLPKAPIPTSSTTKGIASQAMEAEAEFEQDPEPSKETTQNVTPNTSESEAE